MKCFLFGKYDVKKFRTNALTEIFFMYTYVKANSCLNRMKNVIWAFSRFDAIDIEKNL
jgi:hypothetical protein